MGLGGSKETWGNFESLIKSDSEIGNFDVYYYEYPSAPIRLPCFNKNYGSIVALGNGLKTYIEHKLENYGEIFLAGHSLGGLVIREYLLQEHMSHTANKIRKVIFYATPQDGSELAKLGNIFSINHRQLKQLCKNSDYLQDFNFRWGLSHVGSAYDFRVVVAVEDAVVTEHSATANFSHHDLTMITGKNHRTVSKPESPEDLSFLVLKKFLCERKSITSNPPNGALLYDEWLARDGRTNFFADQGRKKIIEDVKIFLTEDCGTIRIAGLSGLGKTRLVLNCLEGADETTQLSTLWIDVSEEPPELVQKVNMWISEEYTGTLVVDNCSPELHDRLYRTVSRPESKLKLISVDTDIQRSGNCRFIVLGRLEDECIKAIMDSLFGKKLDDLDRIAKFAQGFPQMAVLLADARTNEAPDIGSLTDGNLAEKLIWGASKNRNLVDEKILAGCSLFDRFGLDGEASYEYEYIADNIAKVDRSNFYDCVARLSERGLIDRRGRYANLFRNHLL